MSQSHSQYITVPRTAKYYSFGKLDLDTKRIWILFHGYGQLAKYFIRKFEWLDPATNYILAPEALSRFYLEGTKGRIGASWMTSEERLQEIQDFNRYINLLFDQECKKLNLDQFELNIFAFSQGAPTACRWLSQSGLHIQNLILWAGFFPHDMSVSAITDCAEKIHVVHGKNDPYLREDYKDAMTVFSNFPVHVHQFEGKHEIPIDELKQVISRL